jgi:hypothetical protein
MTKAESFLLQVNYRIRQDQYQLRALARKTLDATDEWCPPKKEADVIANLRYFLNVLDNQDQKTWETLVKHSGN